MTQDPPCPAGGGYGQDPRRKRSARSELQVHCCGALVEASEIPGEMGAGRAGVGVGMTPLALSQGGAEEPYGVAFGALNPGWQSRWFVGRCPTISCCP